MKKIIITLLISIVLILSVVFLFRTNFFSSTTSEINNSVEITDEFEGAKVSKEDLVRGCPRRDCIPSIDNPKFESVEEADKWLEDEDRIFGLSYNGVERAYAQRILNWHEIVNDEINGSPIAMTFCPLCGTAVAFIRTVNGEPSEFGVSGFLHDNDLVMYDRLEGNLWQQLTAEAIVGPAARRDEKLELVNALTTTWGEWKKAHPDSEVLKIPENFSRDYSTYPYETYEEDGEIYFGLENSDDRLHPKTVVYGIRVNNKAKAYEESVIKELNTIEDSIDGVSVRVTALQDGSVKIFKLDNEEELDIFRSFWFAWASFNPDTELYTK